VADLHCASDLSAVTREIRILRNSLLVFAAWTLFALLSSAHFFFGYEGANNINSFLNLADNVIVFYWGWALLTPAVIAVAKRFVRDGHFTFGRIALLIAAGMATMIVHGIIHLSLVAILGMLEKPFVPSLLLDYARRHGGGDLATFAVLVGAVILVDTNRRARDRELAAAELQGKLARADVELLRWQLHPHFLFNALNTVSTLVLAGNARAAEDSLTLISRYLRGALSQRADEMVCLSDELSMVERYLEIERLRFGESLNLDVQADESALDVFVPGLIIQPIVENAVRHGSVRMPAARGISIVASRNNGRLRIAITNPNDVADATLLSNARSNDDSDRFGMRYVRERLRQFYGSAATFDLEIQPDQTTATLDLPSGAKA